MDCLDSGALSPEELGVTKKPRWVMENFDIVADSMHNASLGVELIDAIVNKKGLLDLSEGARKWGRSIRKAKGVRILDSFVYTANGRKGWMVPNQYWTPGVLAPMAIVGKYYMHYGAEFLAPRELGRKCAERLKKELIMDNAGVCRFHRLWAEEMLPVAIDSIYGKKDAYLASISSSASRINSRNAGVYWESARNVEMVRTFLERLQKVENNADPVLAQWVDAFSKDPAEASLNFWFEVRKGIDESLRDFL